MLQNESSDIGCKDLCNATSASINLTETFQQCCNEAEQCVLPKQFYNVSCREQMIASCAKNGSQINLTTFALSQIKSKCCRNVTFSENNFTTPRNNGSKCFKINVTWRRAKFKTKHDRVNEVRKNESWSFFLNSVVSQMCLNQCNQLTEGRQICLRMYTPTTLTIEAILSLVISLRCIFGRETTGDPDAVCVTE